MSVATFLLNPKKISRDKETEASGMQAVVAHAATSLQTNQSYDDCQEMMCHNRHQSEDQSIQYYADNGMKNFEDLKLDPENFCDSVCALLYELGMYTRTL